MTNEHDQELDAALDALEAGTRRKKKPTRYHARDVLVALGRRLEEGPDEPRKAVERLARLTAAGPEAWAAVVNDELVLACTEHVQSVDPRWLDHPRYDFQYTVAARERLEARLTAAAHLELSPSEELLDEVSRADELLAPYLERDR